MGTQKKSIARNSVYYMIYEVLNVIFPFLSGMYAARVLLAESIGRVAYAQNIAQYFVILSFLGIPTYGLREISKVRHNPNELSKVYSELLVINGCSTVIFSVVYLIVIASVTAFKENMLLYLVTGGAIAINLLNNSWLYTGLEEFRFISIRNIVFKSLAFIALFVFVKKPEDYLIYALITVLGTVGNYVINILYAPRFVKFTLQGLNFKRHFRPIFQLVVVNLAIELYSLVDVTMLGAISTKENVAYYSYAQKINSILNQLINSLTMVIVPRLALYYKEGKQDDANRLISKDLLTILVLSIPTITGLQIVASDAIELIYGAEFAASAPLLRMLSFLLVVSPVGYLLGSRVLLVTDNEKKMIYCVAVGAIVNIIGNSFLIPRYAHVGAVIASIFSEIVVAVYYITLSRKKFKLIGIKEDAIKILTAALVMGLIAWFSGIFIHNLPLRLFIRIVLAATVYFLLLYVLRESIVFEYAGRFLTKVKNRFEKKGNTDGSQTES